MFMNILLLFRLLNEMSFYKTTKNTKQNVFFTHGKAWHLVLCEIYIVLAIPKNVHNNINI